MIPTPFSTKMGQVLKHVRSIKNASQADMAEILGVTRSQIANIEAGRSRMSLEDFAALKREWGFNADELIDIALDGRIKLKPARRPHKWRRAA